MAIIVNDIEFVDDLTILSGDFRIVKSDEQHIDMILRTFIGHWKEYVNLGVGIDLFRASSGQVGKLKTEIVKQLTSDGYRINKIDVDTTNIDAPKYYLDFERLTNGRL